MDSYWFILITLIICFLMFTALIGCFFIFFLQRKYRKDSEGKAVMTVWRKSGESDDTLQTVEGDHFIIKGVGISKGFSKNPMIRADKSRRVWWPLGRPKILQIHMDRYLYSEGNPEPWDPDDRPLVINDEVLGNLQNVNFSRAMVGRSEEIVSSQDKFRPKPKAPVLLWVIIGVCVIGLIGAVIFLMQSGGTP